MAAVRIAASWFPTPEERAAIMRAAPDAELVHPEADQVGWSRFDCDPVVMGTLMRDADVLVGWAVPPRQAIDAATRLRFICWLHAGCDQLDLMALAERGVSVANVRGANGVTVAEHGMALLLALAKRIRDNDAAAREVRWQGWWDPAVTSVELQGKTVCILGYGNVGVAFARICSGFQMNVTAIRRSGAGQSAGDWPGAESVRVGGPDDARELLGSADFVVVAAPLTNATRGYFDEERLGWLRDGAFLVNVARGGLVNERALHAALTSGRLGGFASDVWWDYPDVMPPSYHFSTPSRLEIQRLPSVVASTDSAANVLAVKDRMIAYGLESLSAYLRGEDIPRLVDPVKGY